METIVCFANVGIMPFCNYKFWFVDVKRWTWYLCIGDQIFKGWLATKSHYHWPFWSNKYFNGQTLAKNLIELLDILWAKEGNCYFY
jgi:hypothetical protein